MPHETHYEPDLIFIPQESRGQTIASFPMSTRLAHVFEDTGIRLFGQLHGLTVSGLTARRNCGVKTVQEIRELVQMIQRGRASIITASTHNGYISSAKRRSNGRVVVPFVGRELNPSDLPISARLANVLRQKRIMRLIDLQDISYEELRSVKGCGKKVAEELVRLLDRVNAGDFHAPDTPFRVTETSELLRSLDQIVAKLPARDHDIFLLRFGATNNRPLTLEEIGSNFKITRERVRQIVEKVLPKIQKEGGPKLNAQLSGISLICHEMVCPLTPEMLSQWLGQTRNEPRFPLAFYVRLLVELNPKIPGWPRGQEPSASQTFLTNTILQALQSGLEDSGPTLPLKTAFQITRTSAKLRLLTAGKFLETIRQSKIVVVQFPQPDQPQVQLRHVRIIPVAKNILKSSDQPLQPDDCRLDGRRRTKRRA